MTKRSVRTTGKPASSCTIRNLLCTTIASGALFYANAAFADANSWLWNGSQGNTLWSDKANWKYDSVAEGVNSDVYKIDQQSTVDMDVDAKLWQLTVRNGSLNVKSGIRLDVNTLQLWNKNGSINIEKNSIINYDNKNSATNILPRYINVDGHFIFRERSGDAGDDLLQFGGFDWVNDKQNDVELSGTGRISFLSSSETLYPKIKFDGVAISPGNKNVLGTLTIGGNGNISNNSILNIRVSDTTSDTLKFQYQNKEKAYLGGVEIGNVETMWNEENAVQETIITPSSTLNVTAYGGPASYKDSYTLISTNMKPTGAFKTVVIDPVLAAAGLEVYYTDKGVFLAQDEAAAIAAGLAPTVSAQPPTDAGTQAVDTGTSTATTPSLATQPTVPAASSTPTQTASTTPVANDATTPSSQPETTIPVAAAPVIQPPPLPLPEPEREPVVATAFSVLALPERLTPSQDALAVAIVSAPVSVEVRDALARLPEASRATALEQLSGESHVSAQAAGVQASIAVGNTINDRLMSQSAAAPSAAPSAASPSSGIAALGYAETDNTTDGADNRFAAYEEPAKVFNPERFAIWGTGFGTRGKIEGQNGVSDIDLVAGGALIGADGSITDTIIAGVYGGYSRAAIDTDDSRAQTDNYHVGAYASSDTGMLTARTGVGYTWQESEVTRSAPLLRQRLTSNYDSVLFNMFGEVGVKLDVAGAVFEPFVNLTHTRSTTNAFAENGGSAALKVQEFSNNSTFTVLGLRTSNTIDLDGMALKANGMIGWKHAYDNERPTTTAQFTGGQTFVVTGRAIDKDAALVSLGSELSVSNSAVVGLAYTGEIANAAYSHTLNTSLRVWF